MQSVHCAATQIRNLQHFNKLSLSLSDSEGDNEPEPVEIEIPVSEGGDAVDMSGITAYDGDGVRVVCKGIAGGKYDFDKNLYVMLLVGNNTGHKIYIDEDNVSVSGYMADVLAFSTDIGDGVWAIWKMELYESSPEDRDVEETSDIEEIGSAIIVRDENRSNKTEG